MMYRRAIFMAKPRMCPKLANRDFCLDQYRLPNRCQDWASLSVALVSAVKSLTASAAKEPFDAASPRNPWGKEAEPNLAGPIVIVSLVMWAKSVTHRAGHQARLHQRVDSLSE
jgi:hypothetical protein